MICNCVLVGTKACESCYNNHSYNYIKTTTINIPQDNLSKEDYKEILKYLIDKLK